MGRKYRWIPIPLSLPAPSPLWRHLTQAALPLILPRCQIARVEYQEEDLARLRALESHRILLIPNHPTDIEPLLMFHLSAIVGQPFFYLATREAFDRFFGLGGLLIRRLGAFSVMRGGIDRASYRATRELLAQPEAKLVVFPEGEVYSQNDTLLPFHSGIFQIAFWALEDMRRAGETSAPLYLLPVAIKYRFVHDITPEIEASLTRLAAVTGAKIAPGMDVYTRLREVGRAILLSLEKEYRLSPASAGKDAAPEDGDANLTDRLDAVKEAILVRVAAAAEVPLPKGATLPERMRALIHVIEEVTREEPTALTIYEKELRRQQQARARPLLHDLRRLSNWIAVYDGYVAARPTPERIADTLIRLERECLGREVLRAPRICSVRLGEPLNLQDCWPAYEAGRRAEVGRVTREMEGRVAALLGASPVPEGLFA